MQRRVTEAVAGAGRVLDLYCGSGLFTLPLAAAGVRVTGIDENRQAIRDANMNVRLTAIPERNVRFLAAPVADALNNVRREAWDAVILDPPRLGCSKPIIEAIFARIAPSRAVYVSCHPDALRLELPAILRQGYRVTQVTAVDMFPHTDPIETIVQLVR